MEGDAVAGRGLGVVDDLATHARLEQRDASRRDALEVERRGRAGAVRGIVDERHEGRADPLAGLEERALLLDRERGEAEVAEHVGDVDDRVGLEHDRVVAGRQLHRVRHLVRLPGRLAADRGGVESREVHRAALGVAGATVGAHRHGQQLGAAARLGDGDPERVRDADLLARRATQAEREHALRLGRGDDRRRRRRPVLPGSPPRSRPTRRPRRAVPGSAAGSDAKPLSSGWSRAIEAADSQRRAKGRVVGPVRGRDPDPLPVDEAEVDDRVLLGDVLVDLVVREACQRAVACA